MQFVILNVVVHAFSAHATSYKMNDTQEQAKPASLLQFLRQISAALLRKEAANSIVVECEMSFLCNRSLRSTNNNRIVYLFVKFIAHTRGGWTVGICHVDGWATILVNKECIRRNDMWSERRASSVSSEIVYLGCWTQVI